MASLSVGIASLAAAVYVEGWVADCPLIPFSFFKPRSVKAFTIASLFFYGCFGVWLFTATQFLKLQYNTEGFKLALWFLPMAAGGVLVSIIGSAILHAVPIPILLGISGVAWVAAPLLLALAQPRYGFWGFVFPSMLCATLGIDLTFTISAVFLSAAQPAHFQGLAGAMCSLLINVAIAFSLAFAQIAEVQVLGGQSAQVSQSMMVQRFTMSYRAAFWYATASASVGLIISVLFVRVSRKTVNAVEEKDVVGNTGDKVGARLSAAESSRSPV